MTYPQSYINFLVHFHGDRDYFECHEILEEFWKESSIKEPIWVGLIQLAVGMYHYRRGKLAGALKMLQGSYRILQQEQTALSHLGMDTEQLFELISQTIDNVNSHVPYTSITLPLCDPQLLHTCQEECQQRRMPFGHPSNLSNTYLVNKHTLRDRSDVISERQNQLQLKKSQRQHQK